MQMQVVPSGVRLADFCPSPDARRSIRGSLNIPQDAPVVGLVARLDKLKGQDDLLDVAKGLTEEFPGIRFLFVGDGWYRYALEKRIDREGLKECVIFTGLVPRRKVADYLAAMDINTLPSYQEGQPRTLVQALLCGCGIVGYQAGGIPEICIDGQTGLLAPVGDRKALQQAIATLLRDANLRKRLTQNGVTHARMQFDAEIMVQKLETIYQGVLAKP
jgi:glycosyltransferase involved in cell wall biosynthesis